MTDQDQLTARALVAALGVLAALIAADTAVVLVLVALGVWTSTPATVLGGTVLMVIAATAAAAWLHLDRAQRASP